MLEQLSSAIGLIYDAGTDPRRWPEALRAIAAASGGRGAHLQWHDGAVVDVALSHDVYAETAQAYLQDYVEIDPRRQLVARLPPGTIIQCHRFFTDEFVKRDPFYREFIIPTGMRYLMGGLILQDGEYAVLMAVHRHLGQDPFSDADLRHMNLLRPHLERALRLSRHLGNSAACPRMFETILDRLAFGVIGTDRTGRVVVMNREAERMVSEGDLVRVRHGRLTVADGGYAARLACAIRDAACTATAGAGRGGAAFVFRSGERSLVLQVIPFAPGSRDLDDRPVCLIVLHGDRTEPSVTRSLIGLFGLTPAEARVAAELAAGATPAEIALAHEVRMTTVRTQVQAVLQKTDCRRQSDLVRLVLTLGKVRQ